MDGYEQCDDSKESGKVMLLAAPLTHVYSGKERRASKSGGKRFLLLSVARLAASFPPSPSLSSAGMLAPLARTGRAPVALSARPTVSPCPSHTLFLPLQSQSRYWTEQEHQRFLEAIQT